MSVLDLWAKLENPGPIYAGLKIGVLISTGWEFAALITEGLIWGYEKGYSPIKITKPLPTISKLSHKSKLIAPFILTGLTCHLYTKPKDRIQFVEDNADWILKAAGYQGDTEVVKERVINLLDLEVEE